MRQNSDDRYQKLLRKVRAGDEESVVILARMIERLGRAPDEESIKTAAAKVLGSIWIVTVDRRHGKLIAPFATRESALAFASEWALRALNDGGLDDEADEVRAARAAGDHQRALDIFSEVLSDQGADAVNDTYVDVDELEVRT